MTEKPFQLAMVTGATSGIGEALAKLLAEKGIDLLLVGRNQEKLRELTLQLSQKVKVETLAADLENPSERVHVIEAIHRKVPDLVINNAGKGFYGDALSGSTEESMKLMELNGMAVMELTLESARTLFSFNKKGTILNVSSVAGFFIFPKFAVYAASKAFVTHLSESLDEEMKGYGIRVLNSCPGMVNTNFRSRAGEAVPATKEKEATMTASYAAEQIWHQIETKKQTTIFNWPYRILAFLARYIFPKKAISFIVKGEIDKRTGNKEIIKLSHDKF